MRYLLQILAVFFCTSLFASAQSHVNIPYFEAYWECWNREYPRDFCSQLENIPVGHGEGKVDIVTLSFGDFTFSKEERARLSIGFLNQYITTLELKKAIQEIHRKGGRVKLALGGPAFPMSKVIKTQNDADQLVQDIETICKQYRFDGIDFVILDEKISADLQLRVYQQCRKALGHDAIITYTIPALSVQHEPWATVLKRGVKHFSAIHLMAFNAKGSDYDPKADITALKNLKVPASKIVWGIMPGHSENPREYLELKEIKQITAYVKKTRLAGIALWNLNRDTNHRTGEIGKDNLLETGQPDGTYIQVISQALAGPSRK